MRQKKSSLAAEPARGLGIQDIIAITRQHGGFSKLTSLQRKLLIAALMGTVLPCDGKVLEVEIQHFLGHLKNRYQFSPHEQQIALQNLKFKFAESDLVQAAKQLPELLSPEDCAQLIAMMWDIACCDQEIHVTELALIFKISDCAGVMRKRANEEQQRAKRTNGMIAQSNAA